VTTARRRAAREPAPVERNLEVVRRARTALPGLPSASLYRVHDLLERWLAEPELGPEVLAELERALDLDP
jgi:hypothetical protein